MACPEPTLEFTPQAADGIAQPIHTLHILVEVPIWTLAHFAEIADTHHLVRLVFTPVPHGLPPSDFQRLLDVARQIAIQHDPDPKWAFHVSQLRPVGRPGSGHPMRERHLYTEGLL